MTFADGVIDDFQQFHKAGLNHPDMDKIRSLLPTSSPSAAVPAIRFDQE